MSSLESGQKATNSHQLELALDQFSDYLRARVPGLCAPFVREIRAVLKTSMCFDVTHTDPSAKEEANVMTAWCFRNTRVIESVHAGELELDDANMKALMMNASSQLEQWILLRDAAREGRVSKAFYNYLVNTYQACYTSKWAIG